MIRKYLPYLLLLFGAASYIFITTHQRGVHSDHVSPKTGIGSPVAPSTGNNSVDDFNRSVSRLIYSKHAHCRMDCRYINEEEVRDILRDGKVNKSKIETDSRGTTYPVEGVAQGHHLRIVFAPKGDDVLEVVTCIDLDRDWPCHCN